MAGFDQLIAQDFEIGQRVTEIASRLTRLEKLSRRLESDVRRISPNEAGFSSRDTVAQSDTPPMIHHPQPRVLISEQATDRYPIPTLTPTGLYESELLADIIAAIPYPIVAVETTGQVTYWSAAARELFGWETNEVLANNSRFVPSDRRVEFERMFARAKAGSPVREVATVRMHRSGQLIPVQVSMTADAGGGVVCVYQRIPEEVPLATFADDSRNSAPHRSEQSRKFETLGRMMAGVVHDINNIHQVIDGNADLLAHWLPEQTVTRGYAEVIRSAIRHGSSLTERILQYARPTANHEPTAINLSQLIRDLTALIRSVVGSSIHTVISPGDNLPPMWVDRSQVEQVILNLVTNARDAMPEGGVIGIRSSIVSISPGRKNWPSELPTGRYICLTIADNGKGMDDPTLARMFDPFFTTKGSSGTGLGLALVREIVEHASGHIEADSQPELGTVFRVYFPSIAQPDDDITDPQTILPILHVGETVLLVDDDDTVRNVAKHALESIGYNVIEAKSGLDAAKLAKVVQEPIDLLVADIVMPGLGGRRLAERLRCTRPGLPVVYVSGYPQSHAEPEPSTRFVSKPYLPHQLLSAVQKVTSQLVTV
jgi:two-component system, cell cycle sensor histidine kinase and response regulator CckA